MARFDPHDSDAIQNAYGQELDILHAGLREVDELLSNLDGRPMGGITRVEYFALMHLVKAFKTCQSIEILFVNGYDEDAEMLLRIVVEQAIRVRWVHKENADERVQAYAQYLWHQQYLALESIRRYLPGVDLSKYPLKEIENGHGEYAKLCKAKKWRNLGSIEQIAGQADMGMSYAIAYRRGSDLIHTNPIIEGDYVRVAGGRTHFNSVGCMPDNGLVPLMATHHLLLIADVLNDLFKLGHDGQLKALMERVQSTRSDDSTEARS